MLILKQFIMLKQFNNFIGNLDRAGNRTMFFVIEVAKETVLDYSQGNVNVM